MQSSYISLYIKHQTKPVFEIECQSHHTLRFITFKSENHFIWNFYIEIASQFHFTFWDWISKSFLDNIEIAYHSQVRLILKCNLFSSATYSQVQLILKCNLFSSASCSYLRSYCNR